MSDKMMPFEHGVLGVLHGHWELTLKSPLVIRHGSESNAKAAFRQKSKDYSKGRGIGMGFAWKETEDKLNDSNKEWSEVTDFHYNFFVNKDNHLDVAYSIPPSSIRGALRQWTIKCLVERKDRELFSIPKKEEDPSVDLEKRMRDARDVMIARKQGWYEILSLFGCTFDIDPNDDDPLTWVGRLRLTTNITSDPLTHTLEASGQLLDSLDGPKNMKRHINVRNPIDRVTMAAKDGGLHFGMEMSEGEQFAIDLHILNPKPTDIRLLVMWAQDIQDGFLRFGGLTSQGRGRVVMDEAKESYCIYVSSASELYKKIMELEKPSLITDVLFKDFWINAELTRSELSLVDFSLLDTI